MADERRLERTSAPGVYRRHASGCKRNGRCRCPYVVTWKQEGRSRKQMFATFELAREHKSKLASGMTTRRPLSSQTVADYYARWFKDYRGRTSRGLDLSTRRGYEISFRRHILPLAVARKRMRDLGAPDVRDWLSKLEDRGAGPTVIQRAKAALSVMLACAVEDGDIAANPAIGVRYVQSERARRRHPKRERRALTAEDVQAILRVMDERWQAFFLLLVQTGVRVGEALGLTWGNVCLDEDPYIVVVEQIYRGRRKPLKTDTSIARVPLSPTLTSRLSALRPAHAARDAPVFASATGTALDYHNVHSRVLQPALKAAGLDGQGIAFHAFRKACGSFLLHEGKTLKQVQGWLRHSQLTTTLNVYVQQVDAGLGGAEVWERVLPDLGRPESVGRREPANRAGAHQAADDGGPTPKGETSLKQTASRFWEGPGP